MSVGLLHGYLLEGSGSNLWTREVVRALCRQGETVHLVCQEPHPEHYDFIAEYVRHEPDGRREQVFRRDAGYPGRCVMHKPVLGKTLPVYVPDRYEEFERVVPMIEMRDREIEAYIERNTQVVERVVHEAQLEALHANHAVLMSVVAQRVRARTGTPVAIMPHGRAIEYAVKKDERFLQYAAGAFAAASRVFVIGREMSERVLDVLGATVDELRQALRRLGRGRTAAQQRTLRDHLESGPPVEVDAFLRAIAPDAEYDLKAPDADLEARLAAIDWRRDAVILFVGRLIANKGPQALLAAAPDVLAARPDARIVLVGHGPLREPLEAMAWALEHGDAPLLRRIVAWGTALEGGAARPFYNVHSYLERLEAEGRLADWLANARAHVSPETVLFTGYLTHRELRHLFACAEAAVFPSRIREAGPLVFLEALASGCYPLGTDFGGMAASIGAVAEALGEEATAPMRLSEDEARVVSDIAVQLPRALEASAAHAADLRRLAVERYDWTNVAHRLAEQLCAMGEA